MADTASRQRFRSALDWWLVIVLAIPTLRFVWGYWQTLSAGRVPSVGLLVASAFFAGAWYCIATTHYTIEREQLIVAWGPFRSRVPLRTIHTLRATRSILSAPANSLDRMEVQSTGGRVVISPRDKRGFVAAIRERVPTVKIEGIAV